MGIGMFTSEVSDKLGYYVYRLSDPRNGETFYIGKGKGNRVFAHANGMLDGDVDSASDKMKRIFEIKNSGFEVQHLIHRHGLDEATAFEVEAALIDAFPSATNIVTGHNADRGVAHASQIVRRYTALPADIEHPSLEIIVNRTFNEKDLYHVTRLAWKISPAKAEKAQYVFAVERGIIVGVFVAHSWHEAHDSIFGRLAWEAGSGRYGFVGEEAPAEIKQRYLYRSVPQRLKGAANPIRYHHL